MTGAGPALAWGNERLPVPSALEHCTVLDARGLATAASPEVLWRKAAEEASRAVAARLGARGRLALVTPDRTRSLPLPSLLPPLLESLAAAGIPSSRVTIVPASGIHRPMSQGELGAWIGEEAARSGAALAPHDADAPALHLGRTPSGIPVDVHPLVGGAGATLLLARIVFHYLAGFGGGRKMLTPGVAARGTVLAVHARCLAATPGAGRHPGAIAGVLEGNPVHEAALEAARLFPPTIAMHIQLSADGGLAAVAVGDFAAGHVRAAQDYARAYCCAVDAPLDGVIVSAGGHPTDRDLVQAHKALDAVAPVVRDGGTVVFVAACADGVGNAEVLQGLALGSPEAIERDLRREFRVGVHTALALRSKTARLRVLALTQLPDDLLALAGMERVGALEQAAKIMAERHGPGARIALAPRGASLLYQLA